jgi:hypothetical protein
VSTDWSRVREVQNSSKLWLVYDGPSRLPKLILSFHHKQAIIIIIIIQTRRRYDVDKAAAAKTAATTTTTANRHSTTESTERGLSSLHTTIFWPKARTVHRQRPFFKKRRFAPNEQSAGIGGPNQHEPSSGYRSTGRKPSAAAVAVPTASTTNRGGGRKKNVLPKRLCCLPMRAEPPAPRQER